jgi:glycosyltransferase involved in cell wall biosynthesis
MGASRTDRPTITFVIPCYNEVRNIEQSITAIEAATHASNITQYEMLVVDDGSNDGTRELVASLAASRPALKLICHAVNLGFGGAYKTGVANARGTYVMMLPGDNGFHPEEISRLLVRLGKADIVIPYPPSLASRGFFRAMLSGSFTRLMNALFLLKLPYFNGPVVHTTDLLRTVPIKTNSFAFQAEALVRLMRRGATYETVEVKPLERTEGRSSALRLKNIVQVTIAIGTLLVDIYGRRANSPPSDNGFDRFRADEHVASPAPRELAERLEERL